MRALRLSRERYETIRKVLERRGPTSMRDLQHLHAIQDWELEEAADHGLLDIWCVQPATGRPSTIVEIANNVNKNYTSNLLPPKKLVPKELSVRHENFVMELSLATPKVRAYYNAGYRPQSYSAARAAATRLSQKHHIRAALLYTQRTWMHFQAFPKDIANFNGTPWLCFLSMLPPDLDSILQHYLAYGRNLAEARKAMVPLLDSHIQEAISHAFRAYDGKMRQHLT